LAAGAAVVSLVSVMACAAEPADKLDRRSLIRDIDAQLSVTTTDPQNLRAVVVLEDGKAVFEKYYGTTRDEYWNVEEITQVVVSTLVGIAIDEGKIAGVDATLGDLLPDRRNDMSADEAATTLAQLLQMTSGFPDDDRIRTYATRPDPVGAILHGTVGSLYRGYQYSAHAAHLLSAVVAHATGTSVLDYARTRLFDPLGIDTDSAGFAWPVDGSGLNLGWSQLRLRPEDVAKIGQLYLDDGRWKGDQLVPASWVGRATCEQVLAQDVDTGYGYGWWVRDEDSEATYYRWGFGNQLLEVVPSRDLVVVMTSEVDRDHPARGDAAALTFLVDDVIIPAVTG
jgi:CubicO group peptidase (beta-lactamase class C family)